MRDPTLYVPVHAGLFAHRKLGRLSARLGIAEVAAVGHLVSLWTSALQQTTDGVLRRWDEFDVARSSRWVGKPSDLLEALVAEGWLEAAIPDTVDDAGEVIPEGTLMVRGWEDYAGRGMQYREKEKRRKADARAAKKGAVPKVSTDKAPLSVDVPRQRNETKRNETELKEEEEGGGALAPKPVAALAQSELEDLPPGPEDRQEARARGAVVAEAHRARSAKAAASEAIYDRPQTVRQFLEFTIEGKTVRSLWSARYPQLDGRSGRPTLEEFATVLWDYSLRQRWGVDGGPVMAWWALKLGEEVRKHARSWETDGGAQAADPARAMARRRYHQLQGLGRDMAPFETWMAERWSKGLDREDDAEKGPVPPVHGSGAPLRARLPVQPAQPVYEADDAGGLALIRAALDPKTRRKSAGGEPS